MGRGNDNGQKVTPSSSWRFSPSRPKGKPKSEPDNDDDDNPGMLSHPPTTSSWTTTKGNGISVATVVPHILSGGLRAFLGVTVALYILNQQHLLPRPLSAMVSKTLFWPTLPITASRRIGKWVTRMDDTVVMGGAPFGFLHYPKKLYRDYRVRREEKGTNSHVGWWSSWDSL
jgi:hypothetical protein